MLLFLLGLVVGGILGITLAAILSTGAIADERMEHMLKKLDQFSLDKQNIIIPKN